MATSHSEDVEGGANEDIDLSQVIADSLSSLTNPEPTDTNHNNNNNNQVQLQNEQPYQPREDSYDNHDGSEVDDLENAIGNVFDQFDFASLNDKKESENVDADLHPKNHKDESYDNIDDAIGKAFENAIHSEQNHQELSLDNALEETAHEQDDDKPRDHELDNAIDRAFEDAMLDHLDEKHEENTEQQEYDQESTSVEHHGIDNEFDKAIQESIAEDTQQEKSNNEDRQEHSEMNDLDLDDAIGNAFKDVLGKENKREDLHLDEGTHTEVETELRTESSHLAESIEESDSKREDENPPQSSHSDNVQNLSLVEEDVEKEDDDLEAAIGNAFSSIFQRPQEPEQNVNNHDIDIVPTLDPKDDSQTTKNHDNTEEIDLEEAIGNAFKSLIPQSLDAHESQSGDPNIPKDDEEHERANNVSLSNERSYLDAADNEEEDAFMEDAINEAFKLAMNKTTRDTTTETRITKTQDDSTELSRIVQNLVSQMASQDQEDNKLPISDHVLQELALEITNQVQAEDDFSRKQKVIDLPQIDDNVLEHFQNEAHRDEIGLRDKEGLDSRRQTEDHMHNNRLQTALANVVRNAIESNATTFDTRAPPRERETDLEQLQMNDTLQNALNMAVEHPLDLLSGVESEDRTSQAREKDQKSYQVNPVPISASTANFLDSLNRSIDIDLNKSKNDSLTDKAAEAKKMSIAETLALHRASMANGPRRDYSSIASLEEVSNSDKVNPIRSQLSSVISSITSRINSGNSSETNLLSVIRQMTNAISSSSLSTFLSGVPSASEIILSYSNSEEKNGIIKSLMVAKQYLVSGVSENSEAKTLIDDVIHQFNYNLDPSLPGSTSSLELPVIKSEHISSISESIIAAISNHSPASRKNRIILEKIKTDSPEYKEKIRFGNRERKKRWREENAERNKDNDLRSRVIKRAATMFGEKDSPEKRAWTEEEFSRRRDRRIAKQRKDEQEKFKNPSEDITDSESKPENDKDTIASLTADQRLVKPVTDIFNLLSGSVFKENPQAVLAATSAATATAAAIYASNISDTDIKLVNSAVSSILMSLMDSSGQHERVSRLSRGVASFRISGPSYNRTSASSPSTLSDTGLSSIVKPPISSNLFNRISETVKGMTTNNNPASLLSLRGLSLHDKRRAETSLDFDSKRPKNDTSDVDSISKIASELDQIRNSISTNTSQIWGSTSALKMPQYRKREASVPRLKEAGHPTLVLPESSPFISNKVGREITKPSTGLRKPGSFQKPVSKPDSGNPKGLKFTPLYSAPFKLN